MIQYLNLFELDNPQRLQRLRPKETVPSVSVKNAVLLLRQSIVFSVAGHLPS